MNSIYHMAAIMAGHASEHVCVNCNDSEEGCDFCEPLREADEVSQEDLEAAAEHYDTLISRF